MASFGGARPKTTSKSSKKQKKNKRKDKRDEKEEDAMPFDKEENVRSEMMSRNPRRVQKEMLADFPNEGTHPNDFRNASDLDQTLCSIPYQLKKISLPEDASENINYSGNSSQYEREQGGAEACHSGNLDNASRKKVYGMKGDYLTSSGNPFFMEMEAISKSLENASLEYREKFIPFSRSPFPPPLDIRVENTRPVLDVNEQSSKVSEERSKQGENKMVEGKDEISRVKFLEFRDNKVPPPSSHVQNKEIFSPTVRCALPSNTIFEGTLRDSIEQEDNPDKPSSKGSEKKKSKDGKSKITEDKDVEISVALEKKIKIREVKEILTEDEDELLAEVEGEAELTSTLEEDEILALLEESDDISASLEVKDEIIEVIKIEEDPFLTHCLDNNEKRLDFPIPRCSSPFYTTSFDQTLRDPLGRIDNQDERNSKESETNLETQPWKNGKNEDEVTEGLEEKDGAKEAFENVNEDRKCNDTNSSEGTECYEVYDEGGHKACFPSITFDFSKYVLLWNRWSIISEESIRKAVKMISPCSRLQLKRSNYSSIWTYGIATFASVKSAKLCVTFFQGFKVKLKSRVDELKPLMDKKKLAMIETMQFTDDETPIVAERIFTWLNYIKILESETEEFDKVEKILHVNSRRITPEKMKVFFLFFGAVRAIKSFVVVKEMYFSEHEIIFVRLYEACAAMFAINSQERLQVALPMRLSMNFDFFASRIERHFYSHLSSSFPLADIFSVLRGSTMQNLAPNTTLDSSEGQQTDVWTSQGDSEGEQQEDDWTSQGDSEGEQQTEGETSQEGSEVQQKEVGTSQRDCEEGQQAEGGTSQEGSEGQQTRVEASQGGSKGQKTKVEASKGGNKEGQENKVEASQGDGNQERQTKVGVSQGGNKEGQQKKVEPSQGDGNQGQQTKVEESQGGKGQEKKVEVSQGGSKEGQQKKVEASQGGSKGQQTKVEASQGGSNKGQQKTVETSKGGNEEGQEKKVEASQGGNEEGQEKKVEASQGGNEEGQQIKIGISQEGNEERHQLDAKSILTQVCQNDKEQLSLKAETEEAYKEEPEPSVEEEPSEMKETGQMSGEIRSQFCRRNETSSEGKSQQSEESTPVQEPNEEKSQGNDGKSNPIQKSKRKGKKKRRR